jgi:hypothetical protein
MSRRGHPPLSPETTVIVDDDDEAGLGEALG